jgi:HK97 family phage portal protein
MIVGNFMNSFGNTAPPAPAIQPLPLPGIYSLSNYTRTPAGQRVDPETAKKIATAYRCANILSDDVGKMPLQTFISRRYGQVERLPPNGALRNIAYRLEISPNDQEWQTPFLFKKMIIQWLLFWGNAYIWAPPDPSRPLHLLNADSTYPEFDLEGHLWYNTRFPNGQTKDIPAVELLHAMINPHPYGYVGRSVLTYARESLGRQLGAYETQSSFLAKGLNPAGIAWVPGSPTRETRQKIRDVYAESFGGSSKAGGLAVMGADEFIKFEGVSMKPVDAQFLESIVATDVDIANFFGVPQFKLNQRWRKLSPGPHG